MFHSCAKVVATRPVQGKLMSPVLLLIVIVIVIEDEEDEQTSLQF